MTGALKPPFAKSELKTENEPREKRGAFVALLEASSFGSALGRGW